MNRLPNGNRPKAVDCLEQQLCGISFAEVATKRERDQALNMKEFAVLSGVSYGTARGWFQTPGFPRIGKTVFFSDFVLWRRAGLKLTEAILTPPPPTIPTKRPPIPGLPARAQLILAECK